MSYRFKHKKISLTLETVFEMWLLSSVFVVVIAGLLQMQNLQVQEQTEVIQSIEQQPAKNFPQISRSNSPALGY